MSSKHSMPEMKEGGVNVTPLIDVVMCLIIFFMLVAKIGVSTGATPMSLPATILGKKIEQIPDTVFVNVTDPNLDRDEKSGMPKLDPATGQPMRLPTRFEMPKVTATFDAKGKPEEIRLTTDAGGHPFRDQIKSIYDARRAMHKENDFSVTLRAEKELPFSMLQVVLAEIATSGVSNVNYGAKAPGGGEAPPAAAAQ